MDRGASTHHRQSPVLATPPRRFGPSERALWQRERLLLAVKLGAVAVLGMSGLLIQPTPPTLILAKWTVLGLAAWGFWLLAGRTLLRPLREREMLLQDQALELRRGDFKRIVVYESLRHVVVVQGPSERLISLRLDLDDDSVLLRDLEGLPEAFAAVAGAKPDQAVIEIEERRVDWGEPLPWALLALVGGLLAALLALR